MNTIRTRLALLAAALTGAVLVALLPTTAASAEPFVCAPTTMSKGVVLVLYKQNGRSCTYTALKVVTPPAPQPTPVPIPTTAPEPAPAVPAAPVAAPVPTPTPTVPVAPAIGGSVSAADPLAAKYAQFAAAFPGSSKYGSGGTCFSMNYGFVQNGTFAPSFKTGNGVFAQVKLTVNSERKGFDVRWYACE